MKKILFLNFIVIFIFLTSTSLAFSINIPSGSQTIENWLSNSSIHYLSLNYPAKPLYNFIFYNNGTTIYNVYYPYYYYESNLNYTNSSTGTQFFLGKTAYPQPFLNNMENTELCNNNYTGNSSVYRFFITLCNLKKANFIANGTLLSEYNITAAEENQYQNNSGYLFNGIYIYKYKNLNNNIQNKTLYNFNNSYNTYNSNSYNSINTEIYNYLRGIVVSTIPKDIFSKLLYLTYAGYSEKCNSQNTQSSPIIIDQSTEKYNSFTIESASCNGNPYNYSLPYFIDYYKYINSLAYFLLTTRNDTPQILYYSLLYGIKNSQLFPNIEGPELFQNDVALLGVYPGIIPSGYEAEKQLNYTQLLVPINYIKNQNTTLLKKNGIKVLSGTYNNITLDVAVQNKINNYSYYNISTNEYPFKGNLKSGPIKYYDSCGGGIGYRTAVENEEKNIKNQFYSIMASDKLYPKNYYNEIPNGSSFGPSLIEAMPTNVSFEYNNLTYGAKYIDGSIAYEKSLHLNFTNQTLLEFNISTNSIKIPSELRQLFATLQSKYSYTMNFYDFNTYFNQPQFNITNGQYQKTISYTVDNKTYSETVTCYTSSVTTNQTYNSSKELYATKTYNYGSNQTSYINVSTNMSAISMFKTNNNGIANTLNYSFVLYKSSIPSKFSYSYVTIPPGSDFQVYSPNESLLESFDASFLNTTAVENGNITNKIYMFGPTWVYPDIYSEATAYYPTYMTIADDNEYTIAYNTYITGITSSGLVGMGLLTAEGILDLGSYLLGLTNKTEFFNSAPFQYLENLHMIQNYYLDGCPYTKIGNMCVVQQTSYAVYPNQTMYENDYNLLNPLLYTQNMYFYYAESPTNLCAKVGFWKNAFETAPVISQFTSGWVQNWKNCPNTNYDGVDYIVMDSQQLNFNTTWKNFTPVTKGLFFNILENSSTYNRTYYGENASTQSTTSATLSGINFNGNYSVIFPESYSSSETKLLTEHNKSSAITIENNGASFNISKGYDELLLKECKLDFCFSATLYPTKVYTMLFYQPEYIGNNTYKISLYPNAYQTYLYPFNNSINENVEVSLTNGGYSIVSSKVGQTSVNMNIGSTFYIKYNPNSTSTSIYSSGNTIYVTAPIFSSYYLSMNFTNNQTLGQNSNYTFMIPKQKLDLNLNFGKQNSLSYWLAIIILIIIAYILYKKGFIDDIKNSIMKKFKEETF